MYKLILFGVGNGSDKVIEILDKKKCNVIAYLDNNKNLQGISKLGIPILPPEEVKNLKFNYIILTSQYSREMLAQLKQLEINESMIIEKPSQLYKYPFNNFDSLQLTKHEFSIISDDCFGGYVYNFFGEKYSSPFIWTFMYNKQYLKVLENLKHYMNKKLEFQSSNYNYPVANLGDIAIHFMHCINIEDAENNWYKRVERLDYNNLFIKITSNDEKIIEKFDKLPYKNKVCFTYNDFSQYDSCVWLKEFDEKSTTNYNDALMSFHKYFNCVEWINEMKI